MNQLLKTAYIPFNRKSQSDVLLLTYRDQTTGIKSTSCFENPEVKFWVSTAEYWDDDSKIKSHRPFSELQEYRCAYRERLRHVASLTGKNADYELQGRDAKHIHHTNNVLCSDFHIEDLAIDDFLYDNDWSKLPNLNLNIAFFDIEVDIIDYEGGFPDENIAPCPINLLTYYRGWNDTMRVYINESDNNEMTEMVRDDARMNALREKLEARMIQQSGHQVQLDIVVCNDERNLIETWVSDIHSDNPDFIAAWNARFDILTLLNRMYQLELNPNFLYGHNQYPNSWYFKIDQRAEKPEERIDTFETPTSWSFVDMMTVYCQLRKGGPKEDAYSLEHISNIVLKHTKEDMREYGQNVTMHNFSRVSPEGFVTYGAIDTFLLNEINRKTYDINFLYQLSLITRTRINAVYYKTIIIRNFYRALLRDVFDLCIANNWNSTRQGSVRYRGGYVAHPYNNDFTGVDLGNLTRSNLVFDNVVDMDFTSMYPSLIQSLNISQDTMFGHIDVLGRNKSYSSEFIDMIATRDPVAIVRSVCGVDPLNHLREVIEYGKQRIHTTT